MTLTDRHAGLLRALVYPVQFDDDPAADGVDRVADQVVRRGALGGSPAEYRDAILAGLAGDEPLAELIPQDHPEATIRRYLETMRVEIERRWPAA